MKSHTDAYDIFLKQFQDIYDFCVLVSYSIPNLNITLDECGSTTILSSIIKADNFNHEKSSIGVVKNFIKVYENRLATYMLIAHFSFFEAYVKSSINELIAFHGGKNNWPKRLSDIYIRIKNLRLKSDIIYHEKPLREPYRNSKHDKYLKHIGSLKNKGYIFPSDLFIHYGIKQFIRNSNGLRAVQLLDFLSEVTQIKFTSKELENYNKIRNLRNKIAHGKNVPLNIYDVRKYSQQLKKIATKIDQHLIENFFIIESV